MTFKRFVNVIEIVVLVVAVGIAAALVAGHVAPADELWRHRWAELAGACVFGLLFLVYTLLLGWGKNPYYRREPA